MGRVRKRAVETMGEKWRELERPNQIQNISNISS